MDRQILLGRVSVPTYTRFSSFGETHVALPGPPSGPIDCHAANEKALRDRLTAIDAHLAEIDVSLAADFPDYAALASPKPISVADVQSNLRDDEALVLILDTAGLAPLPEETFVWIVTKNDVRWLRSELGRVGLQREVAALRCGLDATAWEGDCAATIKVRSQRQSG